MTLNTSTDARKVEMQQLKWAALSLAEQQQALQRSPLVGDLALEQSVKNIIDTVYISRLKLLFFRLRFEMPNLVPIQTVLFWSS